MNPNWQMARDAEFKGCFNDFWKIRNSFKVPYSSRLRTEEDRALMVWLHGMNRGCSIGKAEMLRVLLTYLEQVRTPKLVLDEIRIRFEDV
jgi:hypothetical protein